MWPLYVGVVVFWLLLLLYVAWLHSKIRRLEATARELEKRR